MEATKALEIIEEVLTNTPSSTLHIHFDYRKVHWRVIFNSPFPSEQRIVTGVEHAGLNDAIVEMSRQLAEIDIPVE